MFYSVHLSVHSFVCGLYSYEFVCLFSYAFVSLLVDLFYICEAFGSVLTLRLPFLLTIPMT